MGANMARHLKLNCGYEVVTVYDVNQEAARSLAEELGVEVADDLAQVTKIADVILTVVTDDDAMRVLFLGNHGLLQEASGKTFLNCATLSPAIQREVFAAGKDAGADVLEVAMASSISQAREGSLYLMVGGEKSVFEKQSKLLQDLSVKFRYCGEMGKAAEVKALVNMVMNINTAALAEGLGLAEALGLELEMVREVFSQTGANSRVLETDAEDMVERDHECWFSAKHAAKDSGIAGDLATSVGLELPLNKATKAQYETMIAMGLGDLDKSGIAELTFRGRR